MEKYGYIYKITNIVTGKIYIGQTDKSIQNRFKKHISDALARRNNMYLHKSIRKYGEESFSIEIIEEVPISQLNEKETFYINHYDAFGENGYNLTKGGDGIRGYSHSIETKKRLSELATGRKHKPETIEKIKAYQPTEETRKKIGEVLKGKLRTEESKNLMRKTHPRIRKVFQYTLDGEYKGEYFSVSEAARRLDINYRGIAKTASGGKKSYKGFYWSYHILSDWERAILPHYIKQRIRTPETNKKIAKSNKGHIVSDDTRRKIGKKNSKPVNKFTKDGRYICTYKSVTDAAIDIGNPKKASDISRAARGIIKTSNGFIWRFNGR
jgi:group I intron endonuclease